MLGVQLIVGESCSEQVEQGEGAFLVYGVEQQIFAVLILVLEGFGIGCSQQINAI